MSALVSQRLKEHSISVRHICRISELDMNFKLSHPITLIRKDEI